MVPYETLKALHVACAAASLGGFVVRYALMLAGSPLLRTRAARIAPHVVDTALLASAIALAWMAGAVPLRDAWLTAKILGLLVYIVLGSIALKRGRTRAQRAIAGALAVVVFAFIVSAAVTKSGAGFLAVRQVANPPDRRCFRCDTQAAANAARGTVAPVPGAACAVGAGVSRAPPIELPQCRRPPAVGA
jgi:uncharacterized membrane protein SirB2